MEHVLLLAPSQGLGGGIERYVETVESVFHRHGVRYRRLNLISPGHPHNLRGKFRFMRTVRRALRESSGPTRLVLAHCNLLPVVRVVAQVPNYAGATVILHGAEIWNGRKVRSHRLMRRSDVRVVTVSNFSAGAVAKTAPANVLYPGVSPAWYRTLVAAGIEARRAPGERNLVTVFRLDDWREKGLPTLIDAVRLIGDDRVRLTVCGSGSVTGELVRATSPYEWCRLAPGLSDHDLAQHLADADVFILATRTRPGKRACGEGFGLVLLEAQLAGTPVVAPAYGGSGEAFVPGVTGLAPLDETPEALASALGALLRDDERRLEMGRAAARWSTVCFEPARYGQQVVRTLLGHDAFEVDRAHAEPASPVLQP